MIIGFVVLLLTMVFFSILLFFYSFSFFCQSCLQYFSSTELDFVCGHAGFLLSFLFLLSVLLLAVLFIICVFCS